LAAPETSHQQKAAKFAGFLLCPLPDGGSRVLDASLVVAGIDDLLCRIRFAVVARTFVIAAPGFTSRWWRAL
jgi:hypothetical protein